MGHAAALRYCDRMVRHAAAIGGARTGEARRRRVVCRESRICRKTVQRAARCACYRPAYAWRLREGGRAEDRPWNRIGTDQTPLAAARLIVARGARGSRRAARRIRLV